VEGDRRDPEGGILDGGLLNVIELDVVPPCPECGRPMARVAGPGEHRGWTCVNCNAAGDPEEDHLEDPADSRPCGCEETEALKAERDTFREMARERGDLLVSEVERRLAAERRVSDATALLVETRNGIATLLEHCRTDYIEIVRTDDDSMLDTIDPETIQADLKAILSATPAQAAGTPEQQFQEWAETHPDNPERRAPAQAAEREVTDV
jgi:hypothetical protein